MTTNPTRARGSASTRLVLGLPAMVAMMLVLTSPVARADPAGLDGSWVLVDPSEARERAERKVQVTTAEMGIVMRVLARGPLRRRLEPSLTARFRRRGDSCTVVLDDGRFHTDTGEGGVEITRYGDRVQLRQRCTDEGVVQRFEGGGGVRTDRWRLGVDGRLHLALELRSPRLPAPVRIDHVYVRAAEQG